MAQLYISKMNGDVSGVRIDVREGTNLLSRVEVPMEGFAEALMGLAAVPCWFSTKRDQPGNSLSRDRDHL